VTPSTLVAGSIADDPGLAVAQLPGGHVSLCVRYQAVSPGVTYPIVLESARLSVLLRRGDEGWIARAPALNALGYGQTYAEAMVDLADSIEQYLEFLREDKPRLAPAIAHHQLYVGLLDAPRAVWFASVDAPTVE
jgi:hypothetical protein